MLLRIVCSSIAFVFVSLVQAQELTSLHDWAQTHPDWKENKNELAYLASRCATMFETIGNHFSLHPVHEEQRRSANAYLSNSDIYARIGYFLSIKNGLSELDAVKQQREFSQDFSKRMQANLSQYNNLMVPPLSLDLEICMVNFRFAEVTVKTLEMEYAPSGQLPTSIGLLQNGFDVEALNTIWRYIKSQTDAPADAQLPRLVVQPRLPTNARMVFEFPSEDQPTNGLQINVSPRTLQTWSRSMVNWALGHELVHYAFLMRENQWTPQTIYKNSIKHHCNPEFLRLTGEIADLISDTQPPGRERLRMYSEVFRSCTRHPDQ